MYRHYWSTLFCLALAFPAFSNSFILRTGTQEQSSQTQKVTVFEPTGTILAHPSLKNSVCASLLAAGLAVTIPYFFNLPISIVSEVSLAYLFWHLAVGENLYAEVKRDVWASIYLTPEDKKKLAKIGAGVRAMGPSMPDFEKARAIIFVLEGNSIKELRVLFSSLEENRSENLTNLLLEE